MRNPEALLNSLMLIVSGSRRIPTQTGRELKFRFNPGFIALFLTLMVATACSSGPQDLVIEVHEASTNPGTVHSFNATGSAVAEGLMCAAGNTSTQNLQYLNSGQPNISLLQITKLFECEDSTGSVRLRLHVNLDVTTGETTGDWRVLDGTGDYGNIEGEGTVVGVPVVPGESINDTYTGELNASTD